MLITDCAMHLNTSVHGVLQQAAKDHPFTNWEEVAQRWYNHYLQHDTVNDFVTEWCLTHIESPAFSHA
jgi:hypothetical protein